jgi:hypothetical protein
MANDMTATRTVAHGQVAVFAAVDHCSAECAGIHAARHGTRHKALEPIRQGVAERFGGVEKKPAEGLSIRHDHGSQDISRDVQKEIAWLGPFAIAPASMCGRIWTPPDCNILGSGSAVTIADVYPASLSGPERPSPRAPMDFRALLPQCSRDIGVRRAGPHIRLKKRWDRSLSPSLPGCCNVPDFAFVLSGLRPFRSAHRDGLIGPVVLLSR